MVMFFLLCLTDCTLQTAFAFLSLTQRSQGSLVWPFVLLPNPKLANNSMGTCHGGETVQLLI